jgi:hypothetical protein
LGHKNLPDVGRSSQGGSDFLIGRKFFKKKKSPYLSKEKVPRIVQEEALGKVILSKGESLQAA